MIKKYKAFLKDEKRTVDVDVIFFETEVVKVTDNNFYQFEDIILMQSTGLHDKHGVEIFEGDVVQQVRAYEYSGLEIETPHLEPFEVKEGNYVHGKWITEEVNGDNYSVVRYVFGRDIKVIGNIYENSELLEEV